VNFIFLASPEKLTTEDYRVKTVSFRKMKLGEPDDLAEGRPVPTKETFEMPVDTLIAAISQEPRINGMCHPW
jgi:formate dehydrogenase major subunit